MTGTWNRNIVGKYEKSTSAGGTPDCQFVPPELYVDGWEFKALLYPAGNVEDGCSAS